MAGRELPATVDQARDRIPWGELDAPAFDGEVDATTRAAIDWMRGAWRELEAPPLARPRPRWTRWVPVAAGLAAVWLAWLGLGALEHAPPGERGQPVAVDPNRT